MWRAWPTTATKMTTMATTATTAAQPSPTSNSARAMSSSLEKRLNGGSPSRATSPTPKTPPRAGRRASRARTPSIWLVPSAAMISPEVRNSTLLARPWPRMCSSTAAMASGIPAAAPRAMSPMCSMLW